MKKQTSFSSLAMFALIALVLFACGPKDEKIAEMAKAAISAIAPNVGVEVKDGKLSLSGEVESDELKAKVEEAAKAIKGVKEMTSGLTVKPKGPSPEELAAMAKAAADTALGTSVTTALTALNIPGLAAAVKDSVITLTGTVKRSQLMSVMKAANDLGPKKVENQLTIK
jgi:hyperosmotically inducible periplasmic protein